MSKYFNFNGTSSAVDSQQQQIWNEMEARIAGSSAQGGTTVIVKLRSKAKTVREAEFISKPKNSEWTPQQKAANHATMKKLYRHEHPELKLKRKKSTSDAKRRLSSECNKKPRKVAESLPAVASKTTAASDLDSATNSDSGSVSEVHVNSTTDVDESRIKLADGSASESEDDEVAILAIDELTADEIYKVLQLRSYPRRLGVRYGDEMQFDRKQAIERLKLAAAAGDIVTVRRLGDFHLEGRRAYGVQKDPAQAVEYYKAASSQGDSISSTELGTIYMHGADGIAKDSKQAVKWFEDACAKGGDQGDDQTAWFQLGVIYMKGADNVPTNWRKALNCYERAAAGTCRWVADDAAHNLGVMYMTGTPRGMRKDSLQAGLWFSEGDRDSEYNIGYMQLVETGSLAIKRSLGEFCAPFPARRAFGDRKCGKYETRLSGELNSIVIPNPNGWEVPLYSD